MAKREDLSKRDKTFVNKLKADPIETVAEVNNMQYPEARKRKAEIARPILKVNQTICGAISAKDGRICSREPVEGSNRCSGHGGLSTGATTEEGKAISLSKLNPLARMTAGLYTRYAFTVEEQEMYEYFMNYYYEELDLDLANVMLLDRAIRNFIMQQRKEVALVGEIIDDSESFNDHDMKFAKFMGMLGLDRKFNVSQQNKQPNTVVNMNNLFDFPEK